jgi:hypothetical protein
MRRPAAQRSRLIVSPVRSPAVRFRGLVALLAGAAALVPVGADGQGAPPEAAAPSVNLVDIGAGLGLPRDVHSWDLVVGRVDAGPSPDLVIADHDRVQVLLNHQPGLEATFTRNMSDPHGCALGDVDGNGLTDLYCTQGAEQGAALGRNRLFLQEPAGTWTEHAEAWDVIDRYGRGRRTTFVDLDHEGGLDLFVGNEVGRTDGEVSANRTYLNSGTAPMVMHRLGPIGDKGAVCVQAVDQDRDGWQDLLLCGGSNQPGVVHAGPTDRLYLFRNRPVEGGGRRLVGVAADLGIALRGVRSARLARINGDGLLDLVVVGSRRLTVWPGNGDGGFDPPAFVRDLTAGNWVAVGDVDGRGGRDLFVVQGCNGTATNIRDVLLLHTRGFDFRAVPAPSAPRGCGDTAAMLDLDGDGADEVVVGNGRWASRGPLQVLTAGEYRP